MSDETRDLVERLAIVLHGLGISPDALARMESYRDRGSLGDMWHLWDLPSDSALHISERSKEAARESARRLMDLARLRGEERVEGSAFRDGDHFCPDGESGKCEASASWIFVPFCEHDGEVDHDSRRATLILHPEPRGEDDRG